MSASSGMQEPRQRSIPGQRGVALLTAVILVAIAAVLATAIGFAAAMSARRASANFGAEQALLIAEGAEAMAAYELKQNSGATRQDSLDQQWAMPVGPTDFEGVTLEASLQDQQGKFNINNLIDSSTGLVDQTGLEEFQRLLVLLQIEPKWASMLADWIDADTAPLPDGAEDSTYAALTPPYRTPNLPITSISEIMALPGFGRDRYDRLAPYIAALPPGTAVNLCTAPGQVLDALSPTGKVEYSTNAGDLAARRMGGCAPTLAEFENATGGPQLYAQIGSRVAERSSYFQLRMWITIGSARFSLYSLVHRDPSGNIRPILRTFGTE
jgi:general secretion pathway protein K